MYFNKLYISTSEILYSEVFKLKKILIFILTAALAITVFPSLAFADGFFEEATVTEENVSMRLRPSDNAPVITTLQKGNRIGVYCEEQPGWYRVIFGNYRGYVSSGNIYLASADTMIGLVLSDNTHIRQFANAYSESIGELTVGTAVEISDMSGDWYYVETDSGNGYVDKNGIQLSTNETAISLLKPGMQGAEVARMQVELRNRGFFSGSATGYYGDVTLEAVKSFQKEAKLSQDGIVGEKTLELLYGDNDISTTAAKKAGIKGAVQLSSWDAINKAWKRWSYATVTDVRTGIQYRVMRRGGWMHADSEPATAADTAKMKKAAGGGWTWDRRPIWVTLDSNGVTYAASQNSMPHLIYQIQDNNFPGHFCIHFWRSKVHETERECPRHQACVKEAYRKAK